MANSIFEESPARFDPVSLVRQAEFKLSLTPSAKRVVFRADIPFDRMPRLAALLIQESNSGEISSAGVSDESGVSVEFSLETYARAGIEELSDDIARDAPTIEARGKLSAGLLLLSREAPDASGNRKVFIAYDEIAMVKLPTTIPLADFQAMAFRPPRGKGAK